MAKGFAEFYRKVNGLPEQKSWKIVRHERCAEDLFKFIINKYHFSQGGQVITNIDPNLVMDAIVWDTCTDQPVRFWAKVHERRELTIDKDLYDWAEFQLDNLYQGEINAPNPEYPEFEDEWDVLEEEPDF